MTRVTAWHKPTVPIAPWTGSTLVVSDATIAPILVRDLEPRKARTFFPDALAFAVGYDSLCKQQERLLMDIGTQLIREIRATRGIDELDPGYDDPTVDPFTLRMGHIEKVAVLLEGVDAKLQQIVEQLSNQESPEELAQIVQELVTIAAALA